MYKLFFLFLLIFQSFTVFAQKNLYSSLKFGKYGIGYTDSVIYDDKIKVESFGYNGAYPVFLQIWHPISKNTNDSLLTYGDFKKRKLNDKLKELYRQLTLQLDSSFIETNLSYTCTDYSELNWKISKDELLKEIYHLPVKSVRKHLDTSKTYPVVIYHHGMLGITDENYVMAEYFASHGYMFISASMHTPIEGKSYGTYEIFDSTNRNIKLLNRFALEISGNKEVYYIGHSWGAQRGWNYLSSEMCKAFISLETTIESKTDTLEIKDKWTQVYKNVNARRNSYDIPILLFGNTMIDKPFWFFCRLQGSDDYHISQKEYFDHEAYHSSYFMRLLLQKKYLQADAAELKKQFLVYNLQLKMIFEYIDSLHNESDFDINKYKKSFFIQINP